MGIFVEEAAAFIIGGLIGAAILCPREGVAVTLTLGFVLFAVCLILAAFGILDVAIDHLGSDTPQARTP